MIRRSDFSAVCKIMKRTLHALVHADSKFYMHQIKATCIYRLRLLVAQKQDIHPDVSQIYCAILVFRLFWTFIWKSTACKLFIAESRLASSATAEQCGSAPYLYWKFCFSDTAGQVLHAYWSHVSCRMEFVCGTGKVMQLLLNKKFTGLTVG
jgi:hypothetical protein